MTDPPAEPFVYTTETEQVPKDVLHVIVDKTVTHINDQAFLFCESLKFVQLHDGLLETIGYRAFAFCTALEEIKLPDSVVSIGDEAFCGCDSLKSVQLPKGLETTLGNRAFIACEALEEIDFSDSALVSIGEEAFHSCISLKSVKLPKRLKTLGKEAFYCCKALEEIDISDSAALVSIWDKTFHTCISLKSVQLPKGLETIEKEAFSDCESLSAIFLPDIVSTIGEKAFKNCTSLTSVEVLHIAGLKRIGDYAFQGCKSLTSVRLPDSDTPLTFGYRAFYDCHRLIDIAVPSASEQDRPDSEVFSGCQALFQHSAHQVVGKTSIAVTLLFNTLKNRFDKLPLHKACYSGTEEEIMDVLKNYDCAKDEAMQRDPYNLTALHILAANPKVTKQLFEAVANTLLSAITDAENSLEMTPIHFLSSNCFGDHVRSCLESSLVTRFAGDVFALQDSVSRTPTMRSIASSNSSKSNFTDVQFCFYKRQPCDISAFSLKGHKEVVVKMQERYVNDFVLNLKAHDPKFPMAVQHGWVLFLSIIKNKEHIDSICQFIKNCKLNLVKDLAEAKDGENRRAIDTAVKEIKEAFQARLLFMGRYDIQPGPPLYKSDTCIVLGAFDANVEKYYKEVFDKYADKKSSAMNESSFKDAIDSSNIFANHGDDKERLKKEFKSWDLDGDENISYNEFVIFCKRVLDNGQRRKVAIKFMRHKDQFQNEIDFRENASERAVLEILENYSSKENEEFLSGIESFQLSKSTGDKKLEYYPYAIVMPCADRNLDTIARSEKPDKFKIRSFVKDIAKALKELHKENIIHGDLKLQNIVRSGEKLFLIDLDAAAKIDTSPVDSSTTTTTSASHFSGKKFSSGILPPEMIHEFEDATEINSFNAYFENCGEKEGFDRRWLKKIKPHTIDKRRFAVKTFLTENKTINKFGDKELCPRFDGLPYSPVKAAEAIDLWSLGVLLYFLVVGSPLFEVNVDADMKNGTDAMKKLKDWNDEKKVKLLSSSDIDDAVVFKLLEKLLSKNPSERGTIVEFLEDIEVFEHTDESSLLNDINERVIQLDKKFDSGFLRLGKEFKKEMQLTRTILLHAIYEATEVQTPTTFVVLPEEIPANESLTDDEKNALLGIKLANDGSGFDFADSAPPIVKGWKKNLDQMKAWLADTTDFSRNLRKFTTSDTMYFYLVDELTGLPVTEGKYPIKITTPSDFVPKMMPLIQFGMRAMSLYNGTAGLVRMFGCPLPQVPETIEKNLRESVHILKQKSSVESFKTIHGKVEDNDGKPKSVRGKDLRQLELFFEKEDKEKSFAGLRRIHDDNGGAFWTAVCDEELKEHLEKLSASRSVERISELEESLRKEKEEKEALQTQIKQTQKDPKKDWRCWKRSHRFRRISKSRG